MKFSFLGLASDIPESVDFQVSHQLTSVARSSRCMKYNSCRRSQPFMRFV
uniref:Uncharacterized protein n=1 Tax=Kalanchoe fedtschenkoi TaxID=63787 RepID=A0A7N0UJG8_KALFE